MLALFCALGRSRALLGRFLGTLAAFVFALGWVLCALDRSGLDLGGFGKLQNIIFCGFFVIASIHCDKILDA